MAKSFFELRTWQEAHSLVKEVYAITVHFPQDERFGLTSQLRRSAVSVPSNIAEGSGRGSKKDVCRFLTIARGSIQEVVYQLLLANELGYLSKDKLEDLSTRYQGLSLGVTTQIKALT